jgi:hypothetical protein
MASNLKLEAVQYGYRMEWWPNKEASCVPVGDEGGRRGASLCLPPLF